MFIDQALAVQVVSDFVRKPRTDGTFRINGAEAIKGLGNALSERESDVLRRVAQGYSQKEIAVQFDISVKTVETYKARSLEKLGLDSRVDIMRYAIEQGWLGDTDNGAGGVD